MHLNAVTQITLTQVPTTENPTRSEKYTFLFCNEFSIQSSWANLTTTGKLKFPKNVIVRDKNGTRRNLGSAAGGRNNNLPIIAPVDGQQPLFLRGDKIEIRSGYSYFDKSGRPRIVTSVLPGNWITNVTNKLPIEVEFQDHMFLCKQTLAPNKVWPRSTYTMEKMLAELIKLVNSVHGVNLSMAPNPTGTSTDIGDFRTQNETVAQILERLQHDYKIESFFRGDVLHSGLIVYYPNESKTFSFGFQQNIITDALNYVRTDDVRLSLHAYSVDKKELQSTTKTGRTKTSKKRLEVTVTKLNGKYIEIANTSANDSDLGQVRTMFFWNIGSKDALKKKAIEALSRIYFDGYRGKFTTFMLPFVQHGDIVELSDNRLPERTGQYYVKGVEYQGGMSGMRQVIEIDFRVDGSLSQSVGI